MNQQPPPVAPSRTRYQGEAPAEPDAEPDIDTDEATPPIEDDGEKFMRGVLIAVAITFVLGLIGIVMTLRLV